MSVQPFRCPGTKRNGLPCGHRLFDLDLVDGVVVVRCSKCYTRTTVTMQRGSLRVEWQSAEWEPSPDAFPELVRHRSAP